MIQIKQETDSNHKTALPVFFYNIVPYTHSHGQNPNIGLLAFQVAAMNLETGPVVAVPFGTYGTVLGSGQEGRIQAGGVVRVGGNRV